MVQVNELRLGNWVNSKILGTNHKVTGLLPNTDYAFKVSAKKIGEGWACVGVKDYGGEDRQKIIENNEYNEFTINVKTGETNTSASIYLWSDGTGTFYADDFQLIGKIAPTANKLIPLLNSGFEDGDLNSWTVLGNSVVETSDTTTGKFSLKVTDDQGLERLVEGLTPNTMYDVSVIAKVGKGGWASLGVRNYGDSEIYTPIEASEYSEIKLSFMTGKDSTSALIYFWNDGEETAYFDDFKMMTYVPEN